MTQTQRLGTAPVAVLLKEQAIPASIGILVMSIYGIVDTIFVGKYVGSVAIAAITIVLPIVILVGTTGMAIGVGGSSIIARALGEGQLKKAQHVFGNLVLLILLYALCIMLVGWLFLDDILMLFGGKGEILAVAKTYFKIILPSFPFFVWMMMSNTVVRAEGYPKTAMLAMLVPAIINLLLDPVFILVLDMGIQGAAWATALGYVFAGLFNLVYFFSRKTNLHFTKINYKPDLSIIKEVFSLGSVTMVRQGIISILAIILNNTLFVYGGVLAISVYGIIQRILIFANFPVNGITQGFLPIAGYNYGSKNLERLEKVVQLALRSGTMIALGIFVVIMVFAPQLTKFFTNEKELIDQTIPALRICFLATPLVLIQLISSAYYQAIGRARPALFLALTKQGFFLIPLLLILPHFFGIYAVWIAFPVADVLATIICFYYLKKGMEREVPERYQLLVHQ